MSDIILGCDKNKVSEDKKTQQIISKALKAAGHNVEILNVGPNYTQAEMKKKSSKGKIGVFLVNGADLQTYKDFWTGITKGYYHVKYVYFGLEGWINPKTCSCKGAKSVKLKKADDDASSTGFTSDIVGMTTAEVCEKYKVAIAYACGSSAEELGDNLVKAMGGQSTNSSNSNNTGSTIKDALKDVLYGWDGEAECFIRDDTVYIRKIPSPSESKLSLIEGDNVDLGSVTVTDYNPSTVNKLICNFKDYELTIKDDYLIKRFGTITSHINVDKSIKKLSDAKEFLQREWNKIRRDNGHTLEVKTYGSSKWQQGRWCRVYLPSFNIDDYMYISKVSQEDSGVWACNLTLVDYPPSFGEPTTSNNEDEKNKSDAS